MNPLTIAGVTLVALLALVGGGASGLGAAPHARTAVADTSWGGWRCVPNLPCHIPGQPGQPGQPS